MITYSKVRHPHAHHDMGIVLCVDHRFERSTGAGAVDANGAFARTVSDVGTHTQTHTHEHIHTHIHSHIHIYNTNIHTCMHNAQ